MSTTNMQPQTPIEETERRLLPAQARGIAVAAGLTVAAAALLAVVFATGGLSGGRAAHAAHVAAAAPSPVQLLWRLFLTVAVIALLARACGMLARRVGQPEVVGEIMAGLILGPTLLRTLAPTVFHAIVPTAVLPDLNLLAQAGLVIFMFAVGAEVDRDMLRLHGKVIGAASQAMMVVPFVLGVIAAIPLYATFAGHTARLVPYAIFVGTALSVTAFPVLARIVQETGLRGTRLGSLAMLCAAVCDVLAWCALAVVLAISHAHGPMAAVRALALAAALTVVLLLVVRPLFAALAKRYADAAVPDSVRLLLVVGLIFGLAAATDKIGIHPIFGGFLAGLVLPRDTRLLGRVTEQLGSLNGSLLLPIFFVSIGLQTNVWQAVVRPAVLVGGLVLLVVAVAGKLGGTSVVAWAGGMPRRPALGLGTLMNARGVTDIVVISTGLSIGVINSDAFTMLVIMALLTTMMAGPVLRWLGVSRPGQGPVAGPLLVPDAAGVPAASTDGPSATKHDRPSGE
jgi:Kef-type K+ transport system membrane component KefB